MSLSDRERRVFTQIELDFAGDGRRRGTYFMVVATGVGSVLAAVTAVVLISLAGLPTAAAAICTLLIGVALGVAGSALFQHWRLVKLGARWGPPRVPRWLPIPGFVRRHRV
jgi:hypothetical protein